MIKDPLITGVSYKTRRKRVIARIALLESMLDERRMPSVLRSIRLDLANLYEELGELNEIIEAKGHIKRPSHVKRNQTWKCTYCGTLNLYENSECKMILVDKRKKETAANRNSPSHEEFWDFLE